MLESNTPVHRDEDCLHRPPDAAAIASTMDNRGVTFVYNRGDGLSLPPWISPTGEALPPLYPTPYQFVRLYLYCTENGHVSGYDDMEDQLRNNVHYCRVLNLFIDVFAVFSFYSSSIRSTSTRTLFPRKALAAGV